MNVALSELPDFTCLPGRDLAEHHTAGIIMAPSLAYMEQAYFDARTFGWSKQPIVELVVSSALDDTLAPKGQHVASLFCQHVAPELPDGSSWDDHREGVADLMIETVDRHAPNFKRSVLGRQILSPLDLERTFGLVGGDIFHGALDLGQMFSARPMLGHADYRGPLAGLYMCGAGRIQAAASRIAGTQCGAGSAERFQAPPTLNPILREAAPRPSPSMATGPAFASSGVTASFASRGPRTRVYSLSAAYGRASGARGFAGCARPKSAAAESCPICTMPRRIARVRVK